MLVADRYRLESVVGRGGMGEVWRAADELLGRTVAVKLLLAQRTDPSAAARFQMEAQTSASLSHPHVVGVLDFGSWEGRLYLVMEFVAGGSLADETSDGRRLAPERAAVIAAQAAAALAAAHRQGVVHRDIKPGNLLRDADGTLKLADFGIARFLDDPSAGLTATGQIVGTGLYLAPERALGQQAGPASDVYSLGCVLYQLLTGQAPFTADSATTLLYLHVDAPPTPPRQLVTDLPPAFENYLLGMLAKRPENRPTAREIADWFKAESWRGDAQPLPALDAFESFTAPTARVVTTKPDESTTYRLPTAHHATRVVRRRRVGALAGSRRPRTVGILAAAALFLVSVLIGAGLVRIGWRFRDVSERRLGRGRRRECGTLRGAADARPDGVGTGRRAHRRDGNALGRGFSGRRRPTSEEGRDGKETLTSGIRAGVVRVGRQVGDASDGYPGEHGPCHTCTACEPPTDDRDENGTGSRSPGTRTRWSSSGR
ncbi:serine/threonine-protein kinase [Streptomyces sp. T028]|uniref:serine/threonine-protein kinase n=1 Tax=Streptomyces sp. T028 TaxID=3394379 RepID=UPI003A8676D0